MPPPTHTPITHVFNADDFVGGNPVLDFLNTVSGRDIGQGRDRLVSFAAALDWAAGSGLLAPADVDALAAIAHEAPPRAAAELQELKRLREALFELATAVAAGTQPPLAALELLDKSWHPALRAQMLRAAPGRIDVLPPSGALGLQALRARLALGAVDLLQNTPAERLRLCAGHDCGWLFHDASKNGRRRWCSMATCGNTAKSRRFIEKTKGDNTPGT